MQQQRCTARSPSLLDLLSRTKAFSGQFPDSAYLASPCVGGSTRVWPQIPKMKDLVRRGRHPCQGCLQQELATCHVRRKRVRAQTHLNR